MTNAAEEAQDTETTAIQAYQYLRDMCSWRLLNQNSPLMLGGPVVIVQIDESQFKNKPKVLLLFNKIILYDNIIHIHTKL